MTEPEWIEPQFAEIVHKRQIERHGGRDGIRDASRLEAAMDRPRNLFLYEVPTLFRLAACYAHGIARGHAFVDGNKRTSLVVTATFLNLNGHALVAHGHETAEVWDRLASGAMSETELADWLKVHTI